MTQRIMQQKKRIFSLILAITMVVGIISPGSAITVKAGDFDGYVYVTVEKFTLGQGLAAEPKKIGYIDGESVEDILKRGYGEEKLVLSQSKWGSSFDGFVDGGEPKGWTINDIPEKIIAALEKGAEGPDAPPAVSKTAITNRTKADTLANYDYTGQSCLMLCVDNQSARYGISGLKNGNATDGSTYHDGSVIRVEYGIYHYGGDLNTTWATPLIDFPDKDELIREIVDYTGDKNSNTYANAVKTLEDWDATATEVKNAEDLLNIQEKYSGIYTEALKEMKDKLTNPAYGNEWSVLSIARNGLSDNVWNQLYITSVENKVKEIGSNVLKKNESTENSKIILLLNATGGDPENVGGYNLLKPLADYNYVSKQGVNGTIYALLALDSKNYAVPKLEGEGIQTTRAMLINAILDSQIKGGGWDWMPDAETPDPDLTGMAIQALAPYYNANKNVKSAVDNALSLLSAKQDADGGYSSWGSANSCSCAQVICGLTALGINPDSDERFIKNNKSLLDATLSYYNKNDKGFANKPSEKTASYATDQVMYALTSVFLMLNSNERLFMSSDHKTHGKTFITGAKEATCKETGYTGDKVCDDCGEIIEKGKEIAKKAHTPVEIPAVAATETTAGKTAGKKCSVCGEILEAQKDVPVTGKKEEPKQEEDKSVFESEYKITSDKAKKATVEYTCNSEEMAKSVYIPATIKDEKTNKTYKVTKVGKGALLNNKYIRSATIGKNITVIGANAFSGCSNLKTITIKASKITKIGKNAFKNISKKATIKIYARNKKKYNKIVKLIKKSGAKNVKFTYKKSK